MNPTGATDAPGTPSVAGSYSTFAGPLALIATVPSASTAKPVGANAWATACPGKGATSIFINGYGRYGVHPAPSAKKSSRISNKPFNNERGERGRGE